MKVTFPHPSVLGFVDCNSFHHPVVDLTPASFLAMSFTSEAIGLAYKFPLTYVDSRKELHNLSSE